MHSMRLPNESLFAIWFSSLFISKMLSSDPRFFVVFLILSCNSLFYVSSKFHIFLVLSAKTNIMSDELIFFKLFSKVSWKGFFVSWNLMFSNNLTTSFSKGFNSKTVGGVLLDKRRNCTLCSVFLIEKFLSGSQRSTFGYKGIHYSPCSDILCFSWFLLLNHHKLDRNISQFSTENRIETFFLSCYYTYKIWASWIFISNRQSNSFFPLFVPFSCIQSSCYKRAELFTLVIQAWNFGGCY